VIKNSKIDHNEINLIELMYILWKGKWKVAVAVIISLIAVTSYQSTKTNSFTAITEIKPLGSMELNKFFEFNNLIANARTNTRSNTRSNTVNNTNTDNDNDTDNVAITRDRVTVSGKIKKITSLSLLNLYLDILNDRSLFEDAIRKFNLLETSQYNNEKEYSEEIIRLASSVKILITLS
jgi:hypothetical protein